MPAIPWRSLQQQKRKASRLEGGGQGDTESVNCRRVKKQEQLPSPFSCTTKRQSRWQINQMPSCLAAGNALGDHSWRMIEVHWLQVNRKYGTGDFSHEMQWSLKRSSSWRIWPGIFIFNVWDLSYILQIWERKQQRGSGETYKAGSFTKQIGSSQWASPRSRREWSGVETSEVSLGTSSSCRRRLEGRSAVKP